MKLKLYQADAFTTQLFGGNPAAVVPLASEWLSEELMQSIALENNLSETAFYKPSATDCDFDLRWFTPAAEVDLCGHATLATAHILYDKVGWTADEVSFYTRSGKLIVHKTADGYAMDFPTDNIQAHTRDIALLEQMGITILSAAEGREDLIIELASEQEVRAIQPDMSIVRQLTDRRGLLVTARGEAVDFVSRCFFPLYGIDEDPVTGSAHTTLAPFWAEKLGKTRMTARQISARGGALVCEVKGARTILEGNAVTYLEGVIEVDSF
ncbi:MAG: PhzF family phenazine biosynthesis protein [Saprospiraceae bacterium]